LDAHFTFLRSELVQIFTETDIKGEQLLATNCRQERFDILQH
jgi:hypothetical protein